MATEQPAEGSAPSVESRLAAFFTPAPEVAPTPEEPTTAEVPQEQPTEQPEEAPSEFEELEVDGTVYEVPRELKGKLNEWKEGALRREDYTRKTQELADLHRQAAITAEAITQRAQFEQEISQERTELNRVTAELDRYKAVDWGNLEVNDYVKLKGQMDTLKDRANELHQTINGKAQKAMQALEANKQKLTQEGQKFLAKAIPGWGPEKAQEAMQAMKTMGYTDPELENVYDARLVTIAWKAAQYDRLQSGKSAAVSAVQKAPPVVKPGAGQGPGVAAENRYKELRAKQKKSGSIADTAALLMARGFK